MHKFESFRTEYPDFIYRNYHFTDTGEELQVGFTFEIPGLAVFTPSWRFIKNAGTAFQTVNNRTLEKMVFALGMTELVSYWKITCSPTVHVLAGTLEEHEADWWKDLYYNGLGEFFYVNGIEADADTFMTLQSEGRAFAGQDMPLDVPSGCLIPVGGGKDSVVTIELLKQSAEQTKTYIINPRGATTNTAAIGGYTAENTVIAKRTLDGRMIELNKQGFLNGHTPFSAIVAFSATLAAYMNGLKYIALSNEDSANESTVLGSTVNHQYSKSYKFEEDFRHYETEYLGTGTYYFSLLRPLSEFQIAGFFAGCRDYHQIFRSCNAGSKEDRWCGHCPKCLFVFLILSPFMTHGEICRIFGCDMLEDVSMQTTLEQLIGVVEEKPFECVGSRSEINTAICMTIRQMETKGENLPLLFRYYKTLPMFEEYMALGDTYSSYYNGENGVPEHLLEIVRKNCVHAEA